MGCDGDEPTKRIRGRTICIAIDDFGLHPGTCSAGLRLAAMERVQAIGCMVGGAAWATWHPLLRRLDGRSIDVWLHLDLTERPLTIRPQRLGSLILSSLMRCVDRRAVRAEICAQLDAFERALGHGPAYVDGHQHVHQFAQVRDELLCELQRRYVTPRPWLRSTRTVRTANRQNRLVARRHLDLIKPWVIESLGASGFAAAARRGGFAQNERLCGAYNFTGDETAYLDRLGDWLGACGDADLLMCHASSTRHADDPLIDARLTEYRVLTGDAFGTMLRDQRIALRPMSRILSLGAWQ